MSSNSNNNNNYDSTPIDSLLSTTLNDWITIGNKLLNTLTSTIPTSQQAIDEQTNKFKTIDTELNTIINTAITHQAIQSQIDILNSNIQTYDNNINSFVDELNNLEQSLYNNIEDSYDISKLKPIDVNTLLLHSERLAPMSYLPVDHIERRNYTSHIQPPAIQDYQFNTTLLKHQNNINELQQLINIHKPVEEAPTTKEQAITTDQPQETAESQPIHEYYEEQYRKPKQPKLTVEDIGLDFDL